MPKPSPARRRLTVAAILTTLAVPAWATAAPPGTNLLVSQPSGFGALTTPFTNQSSTSGAIDGPTEGGDRLVADEDNNRYIAFVSEADGLSDADDDRFTNVFVRDRLNGVTILVSRADGAAGAGANGASRQPSISANGRFVAFQSEASNLAPGASGQVGHVYVRDLQAGTTRLVDRADGPDGAIANDESWGPSLTVVSGNPVVAFTSAATNLDGANAGTQVYVRSQSDTTLVSARDGLGTPGNGSAASPSISTDGESVAFESGSNDLVAGDGNNRIDVFVRTLGTSDTTLASTGPLGIGDGDSTDPSISGDGDRVAFTTDATNLDGLAGPDSDAAPDIYVRDISAGDTFLASRATGLGGTKGNEPSTEPSLSDGGSVVVFTTASTNLTAGDTNGTLDIYVRSGLFDMSPSTGLISRPATDTIGDGGSFGPSIPRNGFGDFGTRLIAFTSTADNMGPDDENDHAQVYGRLNGGTIGANPAILISRPTAPGPFRSGVNDSSLRPPLRSNETTSALSADGRYTVFLSASDELSAEDDGRFINVFRRDNLTGETLLVSRASGANGAAANGTSSASGGGISAGPGSPQGSPAISADGNRIAFASAASNLVAGDGNNVPDVFVRDVAAGTTTRVSVTAGGAELTFPSGDPAISADGNRIAFATRSAIDAAADLNNAADIYIRDLAAGTTLLASRIDGPGGAAGNDNSGSPALDADGSRVAFVTQAFNLDPATTDNNGDADVWLRDLATGRTIGLSVNTAGTLTGNDFSTPPAISADGNRVVFSTQATNLGATGDVNGSIPDIVLRDVAAGTTTLVSRANGQNGVSGNSGSERPSISADGTRVAFESSATDLVSPDDNGTFDVLVRDLTAFTTERVSRAPGADGAQLDGSSGAPSISGNGDCIVFQTRAQNAGGLPPGTDFNRVVARALRGDCPFGPVAAPAPGPAPGTPGPAADTTRPVVTRASLKPTRFRAGTRRLKATRRRPAVGSTLRLTLTEAVRVTVRVDLLRPGRRVGKRCLAPRPNRRGRVCQRAIRRGTVAFAGRQGANSRAFTGKIGRKLLAPGRYRATIIARDAAGNASVPRSVRFTILPWTRPR
jgi:Tol biopolymer transport system component